MTTGLFLQARLGSQRLPAKVLLRLGGRTVLERCCLALSEVEADVRVVVTDTASFEQLAPLANACGWTCWAGHPEDVLDRYVQALRHFGVDEVMRATADNPCVSAELARWTRDQARAAHADYGASQGAPLGTGVEVVRATALEKAWREAPAGPDREHVCPWLYGHPDQFRIHRPWVPPAWRADLRLTLDTSDDYQRLESLWRDLGGRTPLAIADLVHWRAP